VDGSETGGGGKSSKMQGSDSSKMQGSGSSKMSVAGRRG
jgi:hypothetical protein